MRRLRLPLYGKILGWLALNLALIVLLSYAFAARDRSGLNQLLTQSVQDRLTSIARDVGEDIYDLKGAERAAMLRKDGGQFGAEFGAEELGPPRPGLPPGAGPPQDPGRPSGPPPDRPDMPRGPGFDGGGTTSGARGPGGPGGPGGPPPGFGPHSSRIDVRSSVGGSGYDVIVDLTVARHGGPPRDLRVTAHLVSLSALLRFLGVWGEIGFVALILLASALFWWPFVWHITRTLGQLLEATRQMSRGRLEVRVPDTRRDELGELAAAVNAMAARLQSYLQGQRQFIADVAHEVISPIARMQIGLGILETQITERGAMALQDVREDLEQMAEMLNELLLFSRSGLASDRSDPQSIDVRHVVDRVLTTDAKGLEVTTDIPADTHVMGYPALIERALSNLLRNARRYAAETHTPVEIAAQPIGARVKVAVRDRGPGVSEGALARLGEPFFRPELSRDRASGGFGLGLAIVRRCAVACGGEVTFRNRSGGGFEAELDLPNASSRQPSPETLEQLRQS
jgi:two-component system, OmpR family, sensor histidine kinase CpxA